MNNNNFNFVQILRIILGRRFSLILFSKFGNKKSQFTNIRLIIDKFYLFYKNNILFILNLCIEFLILQCWY